MHVKTCAQTLLQHEFAVPAGMAGIDFGGAAAELAFILNRPA